MNANSNDAKSVTGLRVFGRAGSTVGYEIRDYLSRTVVSLTGSI